MKIIRGKNNKVVLTVPHAKTLKINVRPLRIYKDREIETEEIAKEIAKRTGCSAVINDTLSDPNKPDLFFDFDEKNKNEFFDAVEKLNPELIIDIHGTAPVGPMFLNPRNEGLRYFRGMREKPILGKRPDVDLEYKRKQGMTTCNGKIAVALANLLAKRGLFVDFEAVYPGGFVIEKLSGLHRSAIALEINRNVREDSEKREKLIQGIVDFINLFAKGERPEEVIDSETFVDTEKIYEEMEEKLKAMKPKMKPEIRYIG